FDPPCDRGVDLLDEMLAVATHGIDGRPSQVRFERRDWRFHRSRWGAALPLLDGALAAHERAARLRCTGAATIRSKPTPLRGKERGPGGVSRRTRAKVLRISVCWLEV